MHTRRRGRLSGATAQRLLDGGDGPAPLPQLIAAATAPATAAELRGESAAMAAFRSVHSTPLPDLPRRSPVRVSASIIIAKAIAAIALTTGTAGGIALATSATSTEQPPSTTIESAAAAASAASSLTTVAPTPTATTPVDDDGVADAVAADRPDSAGAAARTSHEAQAPHATGLCRASNIATAGKATTSPAFDGLNCDDAGTDAHADDAAADPAAGRPSVAPGNPEKRTGKPDGVGRTKNDAKENDSAKKAEKPGKAEKTGSASGQGAAARTDDGSRGRSAEHRQDG